MQTSLRYKIKKIGGDAFLVLRVTSQKSLKLKKTTIFAIFPYALQSRNRPEPQKAATKTRHVINFENLL